MNLNSIKIRIWAALKPALKVRSWEHLNVLYNRKIDQIIYRKKYNTNQLIDFLKQQGLRKDATFFIHSSWDEFYNYSDSPETFIHAILNELGPGGTLAMPAYPYLRKPDSIFDLKSTPTAAGLLAETFRRQSGVYRSINMHSVCALGKYAEYLTCDHQYSVTSWDENSPYYKLTKIEGKILTLGLGKYFVGTTMHVVDSLLRKDCPYFSQFFTEHEERQVRLLDKSIVTISRLTSGRSFRYFFTNRSHNRVIKKLDRSKYKKAKFSNLTVNIYDATHLVERTLELARKGEVVYLQPDPKPYFNK